MKREYDLTSALAQVSKAGVTVTEKPIKFLKYVSGTVSLLTLGAVDYLTSKHGFSVRTEQPK